MPILIPQDVATLVGLVQTRILAICVRPSRPNAEFNPWTLLILPLWRCWSTACFKRSKRPPRPRRHGSRASRSIPRMLLLRLLRLPRLRRARGPGSRRRPRPAECSVRAFACLARACVKSLPAIAARIALAAAAPRKSPASTAQPGHNERKNVDPAT